MRWTQPAVDVAVQESMIAEYVALFGPAAKTNHIVHNTSIFVVAAA